jgi:DKNYY family
MKSNPWNVLMLGLISLLVGCGSKEPYQQRNGVWHFDGQPMQLKSGEHLTPLSGAYAKTEQHGYYRGVALENSDGRSFESLSEHYAKDHKRVYYCDAYRDGKDYFTTQRTRLKLLEADSQHFQYLSDGYARDTKKVFLEGQSFPVKEATSFKVLEYGFARDRLTGYYQDAFVTGSDGSSFKVLDAHYAKDHAHVFYAFTDLSSQPAPRSWRLEGALLDSFEALEDGYAKDAKRAYHAGKSLAGSIPFEVLSLGYAKTNRQVFYEGKAIPGADAASFVMLQPVTEQADAKDSRVKYSLGRKVGQ